jgi:TRAP-type C4-dicarboxylate transport system permease small subunit
VTARLPVPAALWLGKAMAVLSAGVMTLVAWQAVRVAIDQWDERMASLEFSAGLFLVPVAFGAAHSALHLARIAAFGPYRSTHQITALE